MIIKLESAAAFIIYWYAIDSTVTAVIQMVVKLLLTKVYVGLKRLQESILSSYHFFQITISFTYIEQLLSV